MEELFIIREKVFNESVKKGIFTEAYYRLSPRVEYFSENDGKRYLHIFIDETVPRLLSVCKECSYMRYFDFPIAINDQLLTNHECILFLPDRIVSQWYLLDCDSKEINEIQGLIGDISNWPLEIHRKFISKINKILDFDIKTLKQMSKYCIPEDISEEKRIVRDKNNGIIPRRHSLALIDEYKKAYHDAIERCEMISDTFK